MRFGGIICEYNPFHNGHAYQIRQLRVLGVTHIACFMSPNMVQRGELAQTDKWQRAATAVESGADLVFELPAPYALSSADIFAWGGISLMKAAGCTDLCFGALADKESLLSACDVFSTSSCQERIKEIMKQGLSYPVACAQALGIELSPNDMLGLCYLTACKNLDFAPSVHVIKRVGTDHDSDQTSGSFASASLIRKLSEKQQDFSQFAPTAPIGGFQTTTGRIDPIVLFLLRTISSQQAAQAPEISEGLDNRILNAAKTARTLPELLDNVKTKRYPMARIKRSILSMVIGLTKADTHTPPPYLRVLSMNKRGREILSAISKNAPIPVGTSLKKLENSSPAALRFSQLEQRCTDLFAAGCGFTLPAYSDYTVKPYIK